jgi:hypothetical protein
MQLNVMISCTGGHEHGTNTTLRSWVAIFHFQDPWYPCEIERSGALMHHRETIAVLEETKMSKYSLFFLLLLPLSGIIANLIELKNYIFTSLITACTNNFARVGEKREKKTCIGGERTINKIYLIIHKKIENLSDLIIPNRRSTIIQITYNNFC